MRRLAPRELAAVMQTRYHEHLAVGGKRLVGRGERSRRQPRLHDERRAPKACNEPIPLAERERQGLETPFLLRHHRTACIDDALEQPAVLGGIQLVTAAAEKRHRRRALRKRRLMRHRIAAPRAARNDDDAAARRHPGKPLRASEPVRRRAARAHHGKPLAKRLRVPHHVQTLRRARNRPQRCGELLIVARYLMTRP